MRARLCMTDTVATVIKSYLAPGKSTWTVVYVICADYVGPESTFVLVNMYILLPAAASLSNQCYEQSLTSTKPTHF